MTATGRYRATTSVTSSYYHVLVLLLIQCLSNLDNDCNKQKQESVSTIIITQHLLLNLWLMLINCFSPESIHLHLHTMQNSFSMLVSATCDVTLQFATLVMQRRADKVIRMALIGAHTERKKYNLKFKN